MEYQKIILLVTGLLVVLAIGLAMTAAPAKPQTNTSEAAALLFKSAGFGKGLGDYVYSYSDVSDGYKVVYTIQKSGSDGLVQIQNPLSLIKMYLLSNDSILCINYPLNASAVCSSVKGVPDMGNYVSFSRSKFFNDTYIDQATANLQFLAQKGYLQIAPGVKNATVGQYSCGLVNYVIDYRNLTLDEAAKFSIGSNSPRLFFLSSCIDGSSGLAYQNTLAYQDAAGLNHTSTTSVSSFRNGSAGPIVPPSDLSGDAVAVLSDEKQQQIAFARCFTDKTGADREKCVSDTALNLHRKDLCEYAGSRRDRCLVALVPITKDQTICLSINDASFRDDCYVELAGAYKDPSFCTQIADQAKMPECQDAAKPKSGNQTNSTFDPNAFLNYYDKLGQNATANGTNATMNGTAPAANSTGGNATPANSTN